MKQMCFENLREKFIDRQKRFALSLGQIKIATGVSISTLSRFAAGANIDAETAVKIGGWLGLSSEATFGKDTQTLDSADALEGIRNAVLRDEKISEAERRKLLDWFEATYKTFAGKD